MRHRMFAAVLLLALLLGMTGNMTLAHTREFGQITALPAGIGAQVQVGALQTVGG